MAKYSNLTSLFTAIAEAIRAKKGTTDKIVADNFPEEITSIQNGVDVSGVTATAADVLSPKVIVTADGTEATGTIETKTSSDMSVNGRTVTVPAGYYASAASKAVSTATRATPSITVSSAGLITASATQSAGYVSSGTKSATEQLSTQAGTTITPGTSRKTAVSSGKYTTGTVYVQGDSNLVASNIASGVSIFGVTGTALTAITVTGSFPSHTDAISLTVTGLNGRQPKCIWWMDISSGGPPHGAEDGCSAASAGYVTLSSGTKYTGYGKFYENTVNMYYVYATVSGDSISISNGSYDFYGELVFTLIC